MTRARSTLRVNADAPSFGPFRFRAPVDVVGASAVILLAAMLAVLSVIALAAIFGRAVS